MGQQRLSKLFCVFTFLIFLLPTVGGKSFVHPGISHKLSDLERMKYMVKLGKEPWKTSFSLLQANPFASYNYTPKWSLDSTRLVESWGANYNKFGDDTKAAYYNALEWYITGDARYAEKCIQIFNLMRNVRDIESATQPLCAGRFAGKLIEAAEIIKSTYSGWKQSDIDAFKAMLVYPGYSTTVDHSTDAEHSFYWAMFNGDYGRAGNQGLFGFHGIIAMAIFMDNEIMYDRAVRYMKGMKHRSDDLPYPAGMTIRGNLSSSTRYTENHVLAYPYTDNTVPDYGFNEQIQHYIWESGQCHESSRDQSHALLGVHLINCIAEIAWNQGDDLYSWLNSRLLLGLEFYFRYNLSYLYSFPDQTSPWEPTVESGEFIQRWDRSGRTLTKMINPYQDGYSIDSSIYITRGTAIKNSDVYGGKGPVFELALGHYKSRLGLPASKYKWLTRSDSIFRKLHGYEQFGNSSLAILGYGGLTYHRADSCPGDPVTFVDKVPQYRQNIAPCLIQAEDFDIFSANGQNRTFYELSGTKIANDYRSDSAVTIKSIAGSGYKVSDIQAGEWLRYSVFVPEYAKYKVSINYSAINGNGKIKLRIGSQDKTTEISLPATSQDNWSDYVLINDTLLSGIRSFQLIVSGENNVLELNSFKIEKAMEPAKNDYISYQSGNYNTASNWRYSNGAGGVLTSNPTSAPSTSNNVWIQTGHSMTASTAGVNARSMYISGTLIVGNGTSTAYDITLGTSSLPGNLYVQSGGVLSSTTSSGSAVDLINIYGNTIQNDGRIGSINETTSAGSGLRVLCYNPDITTITGTGITNISGLQVGNAISTEQKIIIDTDINLLNTYTNGSTLSLINGSAERANKTLIINEGKTVNFKGGSSALMHQLSTGGAQTTFSGNFNYIINGTLNTGLGGLYLTTANLSVDSTQSLNLSVGSNGKLIIGNKFILIKPYNAQSINFNFEHGSEVIYGGNVVPTMVSTSASGIPAPFPANYSKLTINNPSGISLQNNSKVDSVLNLKRGVLTLGNYSLTIHPNAIISGESDTTHVVTNGKGLLNMTAKSNLKTLFPVGISEKRYDPVEITPQSDAVYSVRVDSVFDVLPKNLTNTNPSEWIINNESNTPALVSFLPSISTSLLSPVVAQISNNGWLEKDATLEGHTFTVQLNSFTVFGTGSSEAFGLKSDLINQNFGNLKYYVNDNVLFLTKLDPGNIARVYNSIGQQIFMGKTNTDNMQILLNSGKGVYFLELYGVDLLSTQVVKILNF